MSVEALLAAAYAGLLTAGGLMLDRLARHTHERSGRFRTNGFSFRAELDAWECPEGEYLHRIELDHSARIVRYRARAAVCNTCPAKDGCTDSDEGREVTRSLDPWPRSESGRFHRAISFVMVALAALVCLVAMLRNTAPLELLLLGAGLAALVLIAAKLGARLLATGSGFPGDPGPPGLRGAGGDDEPASAPGLRRV